MIRVFEAFSGIGTQKMALDSIGISYEVVATSEIDPDAILAYSFAHHFSEMAEENFDFPTENEMIKFLKNKNIGAFSKVTIESFKLEELKKLYKACILNRNLGDISSVEPEEIPEHDLFTYSFPCQDLSTFGSKLGCDEESGTRSSLLWECKKVIEKKRPQYLLLENVRNLTGKSNIKNLEKWISFLDSQGYSSFYEILDSSDYGVPQRRKRVFVVSILNCQKFSFPEKKKLLPLENFLEIENLKFDYYTKHLDKIDLHSVSHSIQFLDDRDWNFNGIIVSKICSTQRAGRKGIKLCKLDKSGSIVYRDITAYESWRLMGVPKKYFDRVKSSNLSDGKLFKLAGNAIVVNVLEEIFKKMFLKETEKMNGTTLFSNIGIAEFFLEEMGVDMVVANELEQDRSRIFSHFYPQCELIVGDILDDNIFNQIVSKSIEKNCEFLIATPPCQGMSVAGKRDYENDSRNFLVRRVFDYIKLVRPKYVIVENVEQQLNTVIEYDGFSSSILEHFERLFSSEYSFNDNKIINCRDHGIPQNRKRAVILMSREGKWNFPEKEKTEVTVRETIGHLPKLEPFERESFSGNNKEFWKLNEYHYPSVHPIRHIVCMKHSPTGKSAFENEVHFPKKIDGTRVKGYNTTYKRMEWDTVAPTITTANGVLSSQCNVHPGNLTSDGTYDNPRVLTVYEIMLLMTIPPHIKFPEWASENLIRKTIGEGIPPLLIKKILSTIPISKL